MRIARFLFLVLALLGALATVSCSPQKTPERPRNVILIGWDGAQRNHVKESLENGKLPNLRRLSSEGALVAIDALRTTDTKAGWTEILTGYVPEVTGVYSNNRYGPIPRGYTLFERLEAFFGADNFVTVAVIGKKGNMDCTPPSEDSGKPIPGGPFYYTKEGMDVFINGLNEDAKVGAKALDLLDQYQDKPFFFFVHFAEVDHKGHSFGENSTQYGDALVSADTWTGKIMEKLKELGLYDKSLIYVTADHGFDEDRKTHTDAPYIFLATNDRRVIRGGDRIDITPTILDRLGVDISKIEPQLDGHPLTKPYQPRIW